MDDIDGEEVVAGRFDRRAVATRTAGELGLLGSKKQELSGRVPEALVEAAKRVSGITDNAELLTYALIKVALEDDWAERTLARKGRVPKGTLFAG